jgi:uroporphyrin-III C-methyltransferase/precorrin-2 dehydrogenase/sirohydrochlorin ferrochelatase
VATRSSSVAAAKRSKSSPAQGIPYSVVPGVTAAIACGAYAGIPLTHRDHARGVRFVTADCKSALDAVDWASLARERDTLAIYMGVGSVQRVEAELLAHGQLPTTPVAFIENGTRADQRVIIGTLEGAAALAAQAGVKSPALLIIGAVAALAPSLNWVWRCPDPRGIPISSTTAQRLTSSDFERTA